MDFFPDAAFLLTVGSFLLTVELFYLQFSFFTYSWSFFAYSFSFLAYSWSFFAYNAKVRLIRALRDCKQRSLTVSKKAPTVSEKASPDFLYPQIIYDTFLALTSCCVFHSQSERLVIRGSGRMLGRLCWSYFCRPCFGTSDLRWPGDSQRESGRFALRIDSQKTPCFHDVRAICANRLKPGIRNFKPPKRDSQNKGFSSGTLK